MRLVLPAELGQGFDHSCLTEESASLERLFCYKYTFESENQMLPTWQPAVPRGSEWPWGPGPPRSARPTFQVRQS